MAIHMKIVQSLKLHRNYLLTEIDLDWFHVLRSHLIFRTRHKLLFVFAYEEINVSSGAHPYQVVLFWQLDSPKGLKVEVNEIVLSVLRQFYVELLFHPTLTNPTDIPTWPFRPKIVSLFVLPNAIYPFQTIIRIYWERIFHFGQRVHLILLLDNKTFKVDETEISLIMKSVNCWIPIQALRYYFGVLFGQATKR